MTNFSDKPIILASQSPRRKLLLEWAEIVFEVMVKETDESYPKDMASTDVPVFIARNKVLALEATGNLSNKIIIAADTIVLLGNDIIGKPRDRADAVSILSRISGKTHKVITGVVCRLNDQEIAFSDTTEVAFHDLLPEEIDFYVDHYHPYDKAGAYAIQEWIGVIGIKSITGDFYNVMGLPVSRVVKALQHFR